RGGEAVADGEDVGDDVAGLVGEGEGDGGVADGHALVRAVAGVVDVQRGAGARDDEGEGARHGAAVGDAEGHVRRGPVFVVFGEVLGEGGDDGPVGGDDGGVGAI